LLDDAQTIASDFLARRDREQRRYFARKPKAIGNILGQLIAARGYGRIQTTANFTEAWQTAVGPALAKYTLPGRLRRGVLEITVGNSMTIQELTFQKQQVLTKLQSQLPDAKIRDLKFRVGKLS
jgi:predicted nucleic acid-binding Zn ribbon protein